MRSLQRFLVAPPWILACLALVAAVSLADEAPHLKSNLDDFVAEGWIYDDIDAGYAKARESGRPLLVVFR